MASSSPTVSVVIPAYNRGALIGAALHSVLDQTVSVDEVIVVDDGSTDQTADIVRSFGGIVRYVHQDNAGAAAARNRGIKLATGDYLAFHDSDDIWVRHKNEVQLECFAKDPEIEFVFGDMANFRSESDVLEPEIKHEDLHAYLVAEKDNLVDLFKWLIQENVVPTPTVLMKRSVFEKVGSFDETLRLAEDYDLWLRVASECRSAFVPDVLLRRRLHGDNLISNWTDRNLAMVSVLKNTGLRLSEQKGLSRNLVVSKMQELRYDLGSRFLKQGNYSRASEMFRSEPVLPDRALRWRIKKAISRALEFCTSEHSNVRAD